MNAWKTQILAVTGLLFVVVASQAGPPEDKPEKPGKVLVAHLAEEVEVLDEMTQEPIGTNYLYVVISVSERSLDAHTGHGDAVDGGELIDGSLWEESSKGEQFEIFVPLEIPAP